jgi:hypothetical protein
MPFRDSMLAVLPPSHTEEGGTAEAICYSIGTVLDGVRDWCVQGVLASMPGVGTNDALYLIGKDMQIDRGPTETDDHYILRLQSAIDQHRVRGSPVELLRTLAAWFSPSVATPLRLVSNNGVWHEINLTTQVVTKTVVSPTNWVWDSFQAVRWWRGWVIIDSSASPWTRDVWGDPGTWGDGGTWGSNASIDQVHQIQRWVEKWKPAHIHAVNIIVAFDAALYTVAATSPPNPDGTSDTPAWRVTQNAIFWDGVL